jgi:DNA-binding SARP family transcriptional activator/predicted RNA-binding Zn ribbon-like protein
MEFRLLGPFEAYHDGVRVEVGSRRHERCLLAILLLEAGKLVPIDRLIELLWAGTPPRAPRGVVHTYIGRLRAMVGRYGLTITTRGDGYLVAPGTHTTDVARFTDLAHRAAGTADLGERVDRYDQALALWRGPLLADTADERLRQRLGADLTELWLSSSELRAEAQLELGRYDAVVTALMTALYRTGRQAEALRRYQATRQTLVRDLGVEPGPDLQRLHAQILRNDPHAGEPPLPVYAVRVRDHVLPWPVGGHPALEFCNTYAGWGGPRLPRGEWLRSYTALAIWAGHVDLADEPTVTRLIRQGEAKPDEAAAVLDEARLLREHLYACLLNPDDRRSFSVVARFVEAAAKHSAFVLDGDGLGRWRLARNGGLRLPVHAAARAAADLLADPRRFTVRACRSEHCGWLFLDQSGLRKYCSLVTCGKIAPAQAVCVPA